MFFKVTAHNVVFTDVKMILKCFGAHFFIISYLQWINAGGGRNIWGK